MKRIRTTLGSFCPWSEIATEPRSIVFQSKAFQARCIVQRQPQQREDHLIDLVVVDLHAGSSLRHGQQFRSLRSN
jgi:hypothetical protein